MKTIKNYDTFVKESKDLEDESTENFLEAAWDLLKAAWDGDTAIVTSLLSSNVVDVNLQCEDGWTALMQAAKNGYTVTVKTLIEYGADVNLTLIDGWSALMMAALNNKTEIVKTLIEYGADVSFIDNGGNSALVYTCKGIWKTKEVQELIILKQPWNIKFFDDMIGFRPELKVKYKDAFYASDLNI